MRLCLHALPSSSDLGTSCGMPLGVLLQPLAVPSDGEAPVPIIDPGADGPQRCAKCKAYMCPFHRWLDGGRAWACALCGSRNEARPGDACHLGPDGRRADAATRPEYSLGSVEYVAGDAYCARPPMRPALLFLIDASSPALACGFTASACDAVRRALDAVAGADRAVVGIAAFDGAPHFFRFRGPGEIPTQLQIADVAEPHSPTPQGAGLLVPLSSHKADICALLESLPNIFSSRRCGSDNALAASLRASVDVLAPTGGRVLTFAAAAHTLGWGAPLAKSGPVPDGDALKACLCPDKAFPRLAAAASEAQVAIDLFLAASAAPGDPSGGHSALMATLAPVVSGTGGSICAYPGFVPSLDFSQLANDVRWNVARPQGYEAVARLRVSSGVAVDGYTACGALRGGDDVDLPTLDCDKAFSAQLRVEERRQDGADFVAQLAVLYSAPDGRRLIRVHTLCVPVAGSLSALFRAADLDAQLTVQARWAATEVLRGKLSAVAIRERLTSDAVTVLHAYRRFCASNSAAGQLILPEALKLLPLYTLGLTKCVGLRTGAHPEERVAWAVRTLGCGTAPLVACCHPRLFDLSDLPPPPEDNPGSPYGPTRWLSSEKLDPESVSLAEDGSSVYIHVPPRASPALVAALFGVPSPDALNPAAPLPQLRTRESRALHALLDAVRKQRGNFLRLRVVRRGDTAGEPAFYSLLVEDRSLAGMSYVEYLCAVHRSIQNKFH